MRRVFRFRVLQLAIVTIAAIGLLGAGDESPRFRRLGNAMICQCGCNQILLQCNHVGCPSSGPMRLELAGFVDKGLSDAQIFDEFVAKYGAIVLAAPTTKGFNLIAWVIPPLAAAAGILLVLFFVRRWRLHPNVQTVDHEFAPVKPIAYDPYRERARQETEV